MCFSLYFNMTLSQCIQCKIVINNFGFIVDSSFSQIKCLPYSLGSFFLTSKWMISKLYNYSLHVLALELLHLNPYYSKTSLTPISRGQGNDFELSYYEVK